MFMPPRRRLRWGLVLAVGLGGCAETTVTYTPLNETPHELRARKPEQVEVFSSTPPERPHVDVGLISVQEGDADETPASLVWALRQSAAAKGCDALLLASPSSTTKPTGATWFDSSYQVYSATCIVYRVPEPGNAGTTFVPTPSSATAVDPRLPPQPTPGRFRMCRDRKDFEASRNCVLDTTQH
jgi:hypothetical protein